jgi:hypothetical protein
MFFRNYVVVDYALEKTKNIVSDFDQLQHADEAGPDPIRATDRRGKWLNVVRSTHVCLLIGGLGACYCTRSRTPSTLVT